MHAFGLDSSLGLELNVQQQSETLPIPSILYSLQRPNEDRPSCIIVELPSPSSKHKVSTVP